MFYLKYRPQRIEELDLESVRERLKRVLSQSAVPHAFLFAGPRGAGKTSAARIVAKLVNCQMSNVKGEPCDECDSCLAIMEGRHLDIIEIDAASNRGIDQIRDLRDKIGLSPSSAKYKVYIIDEVHMLTKEAFNALLKTLEEPPAHAIFVLATTEPHRLPETVRSRCVEVLFAKASEEEVLRSLRRVVEGEKLRVEEEASRRIAASVDGSFRDATKILEESAGTGEKVTVERVEKVIGGKIGEIGEFIRLLEEREVGKLLRFIDERVEEGTDVSWLTKGTLDRLHGEFLAGYGVAAGLVPAGAERRPQGSQLQKGELVRLMRLLEQAAREERDAVIAQMPLELAVIEWTTGGEEA